MRGTGKERFGRALAVVVCWAAISACTWSTRLAEAGQVRPGTTSPSKRPNILIVLTDDQRAQDTMQVLPHVRTWFGDHGRTFPNAFDTTPLCCPSRASLLTGRYAHNTGIVDNTGAGRAALDQHGTIERYLQDAGYRTALFGKLFNFWHVQDDPGYFDRWAIYHPTNIHNGYFGATWNVDGHLRWVDRYSTDFIAGQGVRFLKNSEARDDQPWFMEIATYAPHLGPAPEPSYANAPVGPYPVTPALTERDRSDKPPMVQREHTSFAKYDEARAGQLRMLMSVDDLVAQITKTMQATGEASDTLAFFVSDNGYLWGEHGIISKGYPYRPGVTVPFLMRWPGVVDPGSVDRRLVAILDVAPTILDAAGMEQDPSLPMDGRSLLDPTWGRDRMLLEYWHYRGSTAPPWASLVGTDQQYTEYYGPGGQIVAREYYDLATDPWQLTNLLRGGDPATGPLHRQLSADRSCEGTECP